MFAENNKGQIFSNALSVFLFAVWEGLTLRVGTHAHDTEQRAESR